MTEQPSLKQFLDELSSYSETDGSPASSADNAPAPPIGRVLEIAGSGSKIWMDFSRLQMLLTHSDPSIAMAGQVGSQVKMLVGNSWLIANVRTLSTGNDGKVLGQIDFLGEGHSVAGGRMTNFRRGVTRYPIPGCEVLPVSTEDMRAIFAAADDPHIEVGTV